MAPACIKPRVQPVITAVLVDITQILNIRYSRARSASGVTAVGVYLNLITEQSARINRDTCSPYSGVEEEEKEEKKGEERTKVG